MAVAFLPDPPASPLPAAIGFLRHARYRLQQDYRIKINASLAALTDEQIWWRPNEASNSIGNLILHLCGNARQWIVAGVGGAADSRDRPTEFASRDVVPRAALLARLDETLRDVDAQLRALEDEIAGSGTDAALQRICEPQGFQQTVLDAVFHVVEHFSYHTGQIVLLAKWHAADRIRLYDDGQLNAPSA